MTYLQWFKSLCRSVEESAPFQIQFEAIYIKLDKFEYMRFEREMADYVLGGVSKCYCPDEDNDYIEVQIYHTQFRVMKLAHNERPRFYRGKLFEIDLGFLNKTD